MTSAPMARLAAAVGAGDQQVVAAPGAATATAAAPAAGAHGRRLHRKGDAPEARKVSGWPKRCKLAPCIPVGIQL